MVSATVLPKKWSNPSAQREDYSGEKKHALRKMILVFDPMGTVVAACWNCPGKWNDSKKSRFVSVDL